jgi:hypothetical protein
MPRGSKLWRAARISIIMLVALAAISIIDVRTKQTNRISKKAAIIDPLYPEDPGHHEEMTTILAAHGYKVDDFRGEDVTPELLRKMGAYRVIILRVHSTRNQDMVWFFTGETYSPDKYVLEQIADEVHRARPNLSSKYLFAVGSDYVRHFMKDKLSGALVILMGCDGLTATDLAQAFLDEGASAYVSWDGPVSLEHTDEATLFLLEALTTRSMTLGEAVAHTNTLVGPDPDYNSTLHIYPVEAISHMIG